MKEVVFFAAAAPAIGGAMGVVLLRNPFYSVLSLIAHLMGIALLFMLLHAEFLAMAQLVVYVGAVMVMYVFVVAYIGGVGDPDSGTVGRLGPLFAGAVLAELTIAIVGSGLQALDSEGPVLEAGFGSPAEVGRLILERFLIPFEAASFLLLVAVVGGVVLARRRRGLPVDEDLPERAGRDPLGPRPGPDDIGYDEEGGTAPRPGTAEGPDDPTVEHSAELAPDEEPEPDESEVPA